MEKKIKRIVVMGGSFNPPTAAHFLLMLTAIDAIDADRGIFVPVSDAYLRRKMRGSHPPVVFAPELRIRMLESMCTDPRMTVCDKEIGTIEARTMPTLMEIQSENPDAEIYFLMGADKLTLLAHLAEKGSFLDKINVVLFSRGEADLAKTLREDEQLSQYLDRIVMLPQPEATDSISSSRIREMLLSGETCSDMLCPGVWKLLESFRPEDFHDTIDKFSGEYTFLSNKFPCTFTWRGLDYKNAETAFQLSKFTDMNDRKKLCKSSADKAAMLGNQITPPDGWEAQRLKIMESILTAKFRQNPNLMEKLKATRNSLLIHGNSKHDTFWGVDLYSWQGENNLGKILMSIRDKED